MAFDFETREKDLSAFLEGTSWQGAARHPLGQDASTRRYIRLRKETGESAMLMDAPPVEPPVCPPEADEASRRELGWNAMTRLAASRVDAFVLIAKFLREEAGLRAPDILAHDSATGFALTEDFGEGREFARLIERAEQDEIALYTAAAEALARLHAVPVPRLLTFNADTWPILDFDSVALRANADLYADWLRKEVGGAALSGPSRDRWHQVRDELVARAEAFPRAFTLRDYHAENLLWLPDGEGAGQVGLLDFQDAVMGWDAWDMAMLVQDARRPVSAEASEAAITRYLDLTGKARADFDERLAVIGTLNALRIAGVFSRLQHRDGKARYAAFQPRQLENLARNLTHPALASMATFVLETTPFVFEAQS